MRLHLALLAALVVSACACSGGDPGDGAARGAAAREATGSRTGRLVTAPSLALTGPGGTRVLLREDPSEALVGGEPTLIAGGEVLVIRRPLAAADLDPAAAAWIGRPVRLLGKDGAVCEGVAARLALEGRTYPSTDTDEEGHPLHEAPTADEAWELAASGGRVALVAEIEGAGDCQGAIWAQPSAEAAPTTFAARPADEATRARALGALRALPRHIELQSSYLESQEYIVASASDDRAEHWDERAEATTIHTFPLTASGQGQLVVVSSIVDEGCGGFNGELTAIFRDEGGALTLLNDPEQTAVFRPVAATDLDGDGQLDLLTPDEIHRGPSFQVRQESEIPYHGCRC